PHGAAQATNQHVVPVVRHGRYTLIEMVPERAQRDLMQQVVDIAIPPTFDVTVGAALHYVLLRSGYRLCDAVNTTALYNLPLPAIHLRLGPLSLRDALLALTGPAWEFSVDETSRLVCFNQRMEPVPGAGHAAVVPAEPVAAPAESRIDPLSLDELQPWEMQP
ncbi:MAG: PilL N-terminal domain-containing protein, partial [Rhodanobacter sp.]